MKQHIEYSQILELSDKEKIGMYLLLTDVVLNQLNNPMLSAVSYLECYHTEFNIGKMIEILANNFPTIERELDEWIVTVAAQSKGVIRYHASELVTALWLAVKYILQNK